MRILYILFFLGISFTSTAQINEDLTPEERAYLFHIVKKSPILNNNFGRYFDYQGPEIKFSNQELNYDSIEIMIINQPDLLIIRKEEIAKSPKGLIAEAANKMALWELNKVLLAKRNTPNDLKQYKNEYEFFESLLLIKLPPNAIKVKNGESKPHPRIIKILNPSLTFDEKQMQLESMRFLTMNDQLVALNAMNYAVNAYIQKRSYEIFRALGGQANEYNNVLVAAGDGSSTTGVLEERERDEKGRWNKGLPKAVGLFPYQASIITTETGREHIAIDGRRTTLTEESLEPGRFTVSDFKTAGDNKITNIHLDVWGYNSLKQTTVVIEKNGLHYHLFGSGETRFLSPDSTFAEGNTFQSIINDLEFNKIAKLHEMIYGKKGFDHWIDYNERKKDATELKIVKREKEYSDMGYSPIATSNKPSSSVRRSRRRAIRSGSGSFDGTPTTDSNRRDRKKLQNTIVNLYSLFDAYGNKIKELEEQKKEAIELMSLYQLKLDNFKQIMGLNWATWEEEDGLFTFQDSSTFDILTQEFQFKPSAEVEDFEVRLIAIPESCISQSADEVMLHINVMDAQPDYNARINLELEDVFASDQWDLPKSLFNESDSVALRVFFEGLLDKKMDFSIISRGQGIGKWNGTKTIKDYSPEELNRYPGNASETKFDSTFLRLRKSEVLIRLDRDITLEINSYTDPVKSNISVPNEAVKSAMLKYNLSQNDVLSAYRTASILSSLKTEINVLAGRYLSREEAAIVIDRFNKKWAKAKINIGRASFKLSAFE
ncbi:MAG: hypothetical protein QNK23_12005 [Crocinitomicaceae bacterium]|nr:hypothetical protein [Crocinitomicaceae bacterium]